MTDIIDRLQYAADMQYRMSGSADEMLHDAISEIRKLREEMPAAKSLETAVACLTIERDEARSGVFKQTREIMDLRAEVRRIRSERDTLLLDARDFLRWFNRHYPDMSNNPDHPWCQISDRLNAHADTLATFDSGVETKEEVRECIAERLAAEDFGDTWVNAPEVVKRIRIKGWQDLIDNINRAGYRLVEAEDGR